MSGVTQEMDVPDEITVQGGCHCQAVRYEVVTKPTIIVLRCNCTICIKKQNHHFIVPASQFKLLKGADSITTYTFGTHRAKHTFCSKCGVQSFYHPRSNPDGIAVMPHCLDGLAALRLDYRDVDGQNWETAIAGDTTISKMSAET